MSAPDTLLNIQKWFASVITQPLTCDHNIPLLAPNGKPIAIDSAQYILPSKTLAPHERVELYYRQYWWRLLDVLQENFPLVTRLFGYQSFNEKIGIPYLTAHPSTH